MASLTDPITHGPVRRVLVISQSYARVTNGPARFVRYLVEGLGAEQHGIDLRLLTEDMPDTGEDPGVASGRVMGVEVGAALRVRPLGPWLRMWAYYLAARRLHAEWPFEGVVFINAWTARLMGSLWPSMPLAGMINDDNLAAPRAAGLVGTWRTRLLAGYERWAWARMPLVYTNSDYLTRALETGYGPAGGAVCRLYKSVEAVGIDFRPGRAAGRLARPHVLFVKTDWQRGGLEDLAEALAHHTPGVQEARVTVVGPPSGAFEAIRARVAGALATGRVSLEMLGPQPPAIVRELLYVADVFCVPARAEALGVANIEAALCGTPIVSTRAGGIPEVLEPGGGAVPLAWLAPPGDRAALGAALAASLTETDEERQERAGRLAAQVRTRFDKEAMLDRFAGALHGLLG